MYVHVSLRCAILCNRRPWKGSIPRLRSPTKIWFKTGQRDLLLLLVIVILLLLFLILLIILLFILLVILLLLLILLAILLFIFLLLLPLLLIFLLLILIRLFHIALLLQLLAVTQPLSVLCKFSCCDWKLCRYTRNYHVLNFWPIK